jgi:hypothetical protein
MWKKRNIQSPVDAIEARDDGINSSYRRRLADAILVAVCFVGIAAFLYLFYRDITATLSKQSETPIGFVTDKARGVQRRFLERTIWGQISGGGPIYNGDLIRSGAGAAVTVTLNNNDTLSLQENSLVRVFYPVDGAAEINLVQGNVTVNSGGGGARIVYAGNKEVIAKGNARVTVDLDEGGNAFVRTSRGVAELRDTSGEVHSINAGDAASISPAGTFSTGLPLTQREAAAASRTADAVSALSYSERPPAAPESVPDDLAAPVSSFAQRLDGQEISPPALAEPPTPAPPPPPTLVFPPANGAVGLADITPFLSFRWNASPGSDSFIWSLSSGGEVLAQSPLIRETSWTLPAFLGLAAARLGAAWTWSVVAVRLDAAGGIASRSAPARGAFSVSTAPPASPRVTGARELPPNTGISHE